MRKNSPLLVLEFSNVVYSSLVSSSKGDREYIGSCSTTFKARFNNHVSDSNLIHRRENTMLADHKWYLKERNIAFTQTWKLETFSRSYTPEAGYCNLCLTEKFMINKYHKARKLVNKRNVVFGNQKVGFLFLALFGNVQAITCQNFELGRFSG